MGFETQEQAERFAEHADHLRKKEKEDRLLRSVEEDAMREMNDDRMEFEPDEYEDDSSDFCECGAVGYSIEELDSNRCDGCGKAVQ